jgi:GTP cyclohydrolase I
MSEDQLKQNIKELIKSTGDDPEREGLQETPDRFIKAWKFLNQGYQQNPKDVMKVFENPHNGDGELDQMIVIPKIDFYSMCEHHLSPFYGQIHIAYLPNKKVLGLSKFARLADIFARRLQIQERLTQEIAETIMKELEPYGVGVIIRGIHLCMRSRGVEKQNSEMVTSVMLGYFREKPEVRVEFMGLIKDDK